MKKFILSVCVVSFVFIFSACASDSTEVTPTATINPTASPQQPTETPLPTAKMPPDSTRIDLEPEFREIQADSISRITSTSGVNDIVFDLDGYMWVATDLGAIRWDLTDNSYEKFTEEDGLLGNHITSLAVTPDGSVWFVEYGGLSSFDGTSWTTYPEKGGHLVGLSSNGDLWIEKGGELSYFDGSQWSEADTGEADPWISDITAYAIGLDGTIWAGGYNELWSFNGKHWTDYSSDFIFEVSYLNSFHFSTDGAVWALAAEEIFKFDGNEWAYHSIPVEGELGVYVDLLVIDDERLLVSFISYDNSEVNGVYLFDGEAWEKYSGSEELGDLLVGNILTAPDGALIFGTNMSVFRYDGETWHQFVITEEPIGNQIYAIHRDRDGAIWIATDNGISCFDGLFWKSFQPGFSWLGYQGFAETPDGELVSVGGKGIYRYSDDQWELFIESPKWYIDDSLPPEVFETLFVPDIAVSSQGEVWVSGYFFADPYSGLGVFRYDGENWHHYTAEDWLGDLLELDVEFVETGVLPSDYIMAIAEGPDGAMWLGSDEGGAVRFDGETWMTLSGPEYFPGDTVTDIAIDSDSSLWFSTQNGFSHFDGYSWTVYDLGADPASRGSGYLVVDSEGVVWYSSAQSDFASFEGENFIVYSIDPSLFEDTWGRQMEADQEGRLWLGGYGGLYIIDPTGSSTVDHQTKTPLIGIGDIDHFTSTSNVNDVVFDPEGFMWVASDGGVIQWDLTNNSYTKFTAQDGLAANDVDSLSVERDGTVWAESYGGLSSFDGTGWMLRAFDDRILIGTGPKGNFWTIREISDSYTFSYLDSGQWIGVDSGSQEGPYEIHGYEIGPDGTIWVFYYDELWSFDGDVWTQYPMSDEYEVGYPVFLEISPEGELYVIADGGLFTFDGSAWEKHTLPEEGEMGDIIDLLVMEDGNLFASYVSNENLDNCGVYYFSGTIWEKWAHNDELGNLLVKQIVAAPDGAFIFGTNMGVFRFDGETMLQYIIPNEPAGNQINTFHSSSDGMLWIATGNGISRFDGAQWLNYRPFTPMLSWKWSRYYSGSRAITEKYFWSSLAGFAETSDGDFLSIGGHNVYILEDEQWKFINKIPEERDFFSSSNLFSYIDINSLVLSGEEEIWIAVSYSGALHYDGLNWHLYTSGDYYIDGYELDDEFIEVGVLPGDDIEWVVEGPDGSMWFGGRDGGAVIFDGESWEPISGPEDFLNEPIYDVAKGPDGSLWFATQNGFSQYDGADWKIFDRDAEFSNLGSGSLTVSPQGEIWFFSEATGLTNFDGNVFTDYTLEKDISTNACCWLITVDQGGIIWLGNARDGLFAIQVPD